MLNRFYPHDKDETHSVQLTIEKVGNGTEYPAAVRLELAWCRNVTWAMGYARNDSQFRAADRCSSALRNDAGHFDQWDNGPGRTLARIQRPMERICGPDPETSTTDEDEDGMSGMIWSMGRHQRSPVKKLDRNSWQLPVTIDLNV